jgi:hypothetical protein
MCRVFVWLSILFLSCCGSAPRAADLSSDEPEYPRDARAPFKAAASYEQALQIWKTPEDIHGWIAANFSYDSARAMRLSETQRTRTESISILSPSAFFESKTGVCVDLARFGVETLRRIDPGSDPKYLMIEFDPIQLHGNTLRLHWLVRFTRDGRIYFFADSRRPGHMAGPYDDVRLFVEEYAQYRGRQIVGFRELDSFQKQERPQGMRR